MPTRADLISEARKYLGVKFAHQGRSRATGLDCGGLILVVARALELSELEVLGYADFPTDGKFEQFLNENADRTDYTSSFPHRFDGTELLPGDLLAYDYCNGEGIRHVSIVTRWCEASRRYYVIEAQPKYGVTEHPFASVFARATVRKYLVRGLADS